MTSLRLVSRGILGNARGRNCNTVHWKLASMYSEAAALNNLATGVPESAARPRVIIAEDFVLIQENIRRALQQHCHIVATVEDGASALAAIESHSPDVLLLDVSLPDMSGFAVVEQLTRTNAPVKVILVTAYADRAYVERAFEVGARGYVLKGRMWTDLPDAVREVARGGTYKSPLLENRSVVQPSR